MEAKEKFKEKIISGEIKLPQTASELLGIIESFEFSNSIEGEIAEHKEFFMQALESQCLTDSKDSSIRWAWLSNMRRRTLKSAKNKKLDSSCTVIFGETLTRLVIKDLVREERVHINRTAKKVFPKSQFENSN